MSATRIPRTHLPLRIPPADLAVINQEAKRRGLNRTEYVIRAATGRLPDQERELARRVSDLERTVERLETLAFG